MSSLANMTDRQNMLLTQLSYHTELLGGVCIDMDISSILDSNSIELDNNTRVLLEELRDGGYGDITIKGVETDSVTGFGAIAFTDGDGNTGFSFRGTDGLPSATNPSWNDWIDNLEAAVTGTSIQSAQAELFFEKYSDTNGNNYLFGHSKGGELSESVFVNHYGEIVEIHLLNPQPINPYSLTNDQLIAMNSDKVDIVVIEWDYVWLLGLQSTWKNIRVVQGNGGNPHYFSTAQFDENGNIVPGKQAFLDMVGYFIVSRIAMKFQLFGSTIGLVYNAIVRVVDFVREDLIPAAKEFIAWVSDKVSQIAEDLVDFAHQLTEFLSETLNKVSEWYNKNFNPSYKYANAYPEIIVDTNKLRDYASRLADVNRRVSNLDGRLDGLYWKVGLLGLWNLMMADLLTGYSWRLSRCASYLNDTATWFEDAEQDIMNNL